MSDAEPLVDARGLTRRFGPLVAVGGIDLAVVRGETFGLIGPDGAGKTTTLRMVLGLLPRDGGTVATCGLDPARARRALSRRAGYMAQRFSLYGDLSVDENIAFFARVQGVRRFGPRRDELLERLRMAPLRKRLADRLSGGMKQKLALACTLIHTPELLVLDEPTTGVDPVSRRDFWRMLSELGREGLTILLTTPYLDEAERCHRVALMDHGRLLVSDEPGKLRAAHPGVLVEIVATPRDRARARIAAASGVADVEVFGERIHATLPGTRGDAAGEAADRLARLLRDDAIEVLSARAVAPSLEDVFIARIRAVSSSEAEVRP